MSSFGIDFVESKYEGASEAERLDTFAKENGYWRIYKYKANAGGEYTEYMAVNDPADPNEQAMFQSPYVHEPVLVYER